MSYRCISQPFSFARFTNSARRARVSILNYEKFAAFAANAGLTAAAEHHPAPIKGFLGRIGDQHIFQAGFPARIRLLAGPNHLREGVVRLAVQYEIQEVK